MFSSKVASTNCQIFLPERKNCFKGERGRGIKFSYRTQTYAWKARGGKKNGERKGLKKEVKEFIAHVVPVQDDQQDICIHRQGLKQRRRRNR